MLNYILTILYTHVTLSAGGNVLGQRNLIIKAYVELTFGIVNSTELTFGIVPVPVIFDLH